MQPALIHSYLTIYYGGVDLHSWFVLFSEKWRKSPTIERLHFENKQILE